ncbi:hypothetical protein [Chryseobacterium takakiae]|uniref:Thymidylate kinase n=1 Tax=Chryseobacterium takakiae TaxID=1302685 RepID=A0A1M4TRS0_9FLAO|nr:hypothetical protein [Chryseobacterium takakiae]SHE47143.1 Thymidylate kinase [Chryseobacterium takakiae]
MKTLFNNTGYKLYTTEQPGSLKISFSYIRNSDGSLRWFWNSKSKKPLFLKFYNASSFKARLYAMAVKLVFELGLQNLIFEKETLYYKVEGKPVFNIKSGWAIFTGTPGPNNKALLYTAGSFYKIACTETAKDLLINELANVRFASSSRLYSVPKTILHNGSILQTEDVSINGQRRNSFGRIHAKTVQGITNKYQRRCSIADWGYFQMLKKDLKTIHDERIPPNLIRKLNEILGKIDETQSVTLSFSHGDFTPWNCFVYYNSLSVYDWELASCEKPKGFDFFHFIIQNGILVDKKPWKSILNEIKQKNRLAFHFNEGELYHHLKFYLLTNILAYLKIYSEQKEWHLQIHWLLQTWTDALNYFAKDSYTERELLIMDIFDSLHNIPYAALKFHSQEPEKLSLDSDIDMLMSSRDAENLIRFLKRNSLAERVAVSKTSFMYRIRIITNDKQILNLDLIMKIQWKGLEFMNVDKMIKRALVNEFGVKTSCDTDTAKYLHYFYTLNGSEVPERYKDFTEKNIPEHKLIKISEHINQLKRRTKQRLSFLKNTFTYINDTFSEKGFVMTFSGVDGAGKSTVISEISNLIEKRYRRPVKILRHRPSLLPILSVWVKGKEKAHLDVVNSLPRQGSNNNSLSSFARFCYYYTDYIIGQFIIYLKYVMRGKIVLYDRYYFDFMADARRSNINLPKSVAESGYFFLMKPKFNFFLYASPEKILSRKEELSYQSISYLNTEYNKLFSKLGKHNNNAKYIAIENNNLNDTLDIIMNSIISTK